MYTALCTLTLSGCASLEKWTSFEDEQVQDAVEEEKMPLVVNSDERQNAILRASSDFQQQYKNKWQLKSGGQNNMNSPMANSKNINHYVRGIMQDLLSNLQYVNASTPMAVTSFVYLDSDFTTSTLLGNQLSEGFMHEVHKLGIPVVDFKTTDYIRITEQGDFSLSRDRLELSGDIPIRYLLTGTLVKHQNGTLVNARIVGMESKAIVASAQGFIPSYISNHIMKSNHNDGIPVMSN